MEIEWVDTGEGKHEGYLDYVFDLIAWYFECKDAFRDFPYNEDDITPALELVETFDKAEYDLRDLACLP